MKRRDRTNSNTTGGIIEAGAQVADVVSAHPLLLMPLAQMGIRPPFGTNTLLQLCQGRSIGTELCADILLLFTQTDFKPQKPVAYNLLPLSEFFVGLQKELVAGIQIIGQHLQHLAKANNGDSGPNPLLTLFNSYLGTLTQMCHSQEETFVATLTHLYECYYSPATDSVHITAQALLLTGKKSELPTGELCDIISLLLRHTSGNYNQLAFNGVIQQLCNLRSMLEGSERIRTKLLHPLAADMCKAIAKRGPQPKPTQL